MEDFLELEDWLEDIDQNSKQKLDDDRYTSGKALETSPRADIGRHEPDEIDQYPHESPYTTSHEKRSLKIKTRPPSDLETSSPEAKIICPSSVLDGEGASRERARTTQAHNTE
ncbi:hypothetical protein Bca4012_020351 [Brassica carinata]|uniref:Uncharacterized protein n=1 Tax=Brassica carinata TaxID=52824 RepID=A0A8X7WJ34_BRACI|nr:hypothetical protein Bca52824_001275 [Brassica carinata]